MGPPSDFKHSLLYAHTLLTKHQRYINGKNKQLDVALIRVKQCIRNQFSFASPPERNYLGQAKSSQVSGIGPSSGWGPSNLILSRAIEEEGGASPMNEMTLKGNSELFFYTY